MLYAEFNTQTQLNEAAQRLRAGCSVLMKKTEVQSAACSEPQFSSRPVQEQQMDLQPAVGRFIGSVTTDNHTV